MTSTGLITIREIKEMLKKCAPGHTWIEKDHRIHVTYNGKAFRNLPTGAHNNKGRVQRPWVKKLARHLEIVDCANKEISSLQA